ncbi:MAG: ABC transporter ATP-binding protein [Acidobacteriota bacterium]
MNENAVITAALEHHFGDEPILRQLDLSVPRGCVYGLLGKNGSGKTTLIRLLLGMLEPTSGRCEVLGKNPQHDSLAIRSRVGYVPQETDLDPSMTVEGTLRFVSGFYPGTWQSSRAEELLDRFELARRKRVAQLSGGQRARLALITALSFDPELLILDEPTAGLDALVRRDVIETLIEYVSAEERTVFLCSHLLNEVEMLADRVGIIDGGQMLMESSVDRLKADLCRVSAKFEAPPVRNDLHGLVSCRHLGERWRIAAWAHSESEREALMAALRRQGARDLSLDESSLESIFVDLVGRHAHA